MLKDVEWAKDGTYIPGEEFSPERFFNDGLKPSCSFDLQLGYFSSATISVLAEGFATFIAMAELCVLSSTRLFLKKIRKLSRKESLVKWLIVWICLILNLFERHLMSTRISFQMLVVSDFSNRIQIKSLSQRNIRE